MKKGKQLTAFCYRSGRIEFGQETPKGAMQIAKGPAKRINELITARARWSYPTKPGGNDEVPLVPGIPEAKDSNAALDALLTFSKEIRRDLATSTAHH